MSRMPLVAFSALVLATIGAFFVAQHLKVSTPLIAGGPRPFPAVISPQQTGCGGFNRYTRFSFYLLHRADDVSVYVVDAGGAIVRTLASGRHMRRGVRFPDGDFPWDGREDDGKLAPDGVYYFRIALQRQGRTIELTKTPVMVKTQPPRPVVTSISPSLIPAKPGASVRISYRGVEKRGATVRIYRTDLGPRPRLVKTFGAHAGSSATWDGTIQKGPAPAGTYLVGLQTTDAACNTGQFPATLPPRPGSTPHAGLTVRYLAAQPPLDPVPAGEATIVYVDSRHRPYSWSLRRVGSRRNVSHGAARSFALRLRLPGAQAGGYVLHIQSGANRTSVPLVARAPDGAQKLGRILVVLPALSWQGQNPVDGDGDGVPDTLDVGGPIALKRPFAHGLPPEFSDQAGLLAYLDRNHLPYDATTDLGLIDGAGPPLGAYKAVVLDGAERWLPASLGASLRSYVRSGGRVVSIGVDSLLRAVSVAAGKAIDPTAPAATDALEARPEAIVRHNRQLLLVIRDGLGIFTSTAGAFPGYDTYQAIGSVAPPAEAIESAAGASDAAVAIAGYRLGRGVVVRVGLSGFGGRLARDVDSQELARRLWAVLSR